tara:strand:+ start:77 stop:313 length:237 start_codon:yes stop_codon:yes gene_type:complete
MNFQNKIRAAEKKIEDIKNKLFIDGNGTVQRGYVFNGRPMPKEEQEKLKKEYISAYADLSIIYMDMRDAEEKKAKENK